MDYTAGKEGTSSINHSVLLGRSLPTIEKNSSTYYHNQGGLKE